MKQNIKLLILLLLGTLATKNAFASPALIYPASDNSSLAERGVVLKDLRWPNGKTIKVAFDFHGQDFSRTPVCRAISSRTACESHIKQTVATAASIWSQYGNIHFQFDVPWDQGEVRINFENSSNSNSHVGINAQRIQKHERTMLLGVGSDEQWFRATVIHEFGHALGFMHEHQSPKVRYSWNMQQISKDTGWSIQKVASNITEPLNQGQLNKTSLFVTAFDPRSIMIYYIPRRWVSATDNANPSACPSKTKVFCVEPSLELSQLDKQTMAQIYPASNVEAMRPTAPQHVSAKAVSGSSVQISWTDSSDNENGFYIYRWNGSAWSKTGEVNANETTYVDTKPSKGINHYTVAAYNKQGENRYNGYVSARILTSTPIQPSDYPKCVDGNMKREGNQDCCLDGNNKKRCFDD